MQRMTILGLSKTQLKMAKILYRTLPDTKVYEIDKKLIVEAVITEEDKRIITEQYNKTGNVVLFEDI